MRASVVHGGAPDIYESRKYAKYYRTFGEDPIRDMGPIVAACLPQKLFEGLPGAHAGTHQAITDKARESGQISKACPANRFLEPNPRAIA